IYNPLNFTITSEAERRITLTAIALKRYQLVHGKFPVALSGLAPEFVPSVPRDPIDGQPLRYRLMSNGNFLLYSIGQNDCDDGGDGSSKTISPHFLGIWTRFDALDWVWPQPASPADIQSFYAHLTRLSGFDLR
ncbi:MAG: hypothetical protein ACREE6_12560, partial [Limisphaerales bacterium]